jgi:fatty-acyl-CoA synthase
MRGLDELGIPILHAWGMTETSPVATVASPRTQDEALDDDARANARVRQGQPIPLVELRMVDPVTGDVVPCDDETSGEIQAAGPWIASQYYRDESGATQFTDDGWFRTGDVATVDRYGSIKIVDRTKDLVKSGGEWISSVQLENAIMSHPKVVEAAVIGLPHERWVERPLACVVVEPGETLTAAELRAHLEPLVARWWLPDAVEFIDEVPKTSVGKFSKRTLRESSRATNSPTLPEPARPTQQRSAHDRPDGLAVGVQRHAPRAGQRVDHLQATAAGAVGSIGAARGSGPAGRRARRRTGRRA